MVACKSKINKQSTSFYVVSTEDYCGGAYPPDEIIEDLKTPKNFTGTLYIHSERNRSDKGVSLNVKDGNASISGLVAGDYYVFRYEQPEAIKTKKINENQAPDPTNVQVSQRCLEERAKTVLTRFTLLKETLAVKLQLHLVCDPCMPPRP